MDKGYIYHPVTWILIAFILGVVLTILVAREIIPVALPICPA